MMFSGGTSAPIATASRNCRVISRGALIRSSVTIAAFVRLSSKEPQRAMPVEWGQAGGGFETDVAVDAVDRRHLLKDVTNLIAQEDAHVLAIAGDVGGGAHVRLRLKLRVQDFGQLSRLLGKLEGLAGVEQARRA